jgi:hypothetical protein
MRETNEVHFWHDILHEQRKLGQRSRPTVIFTKPASYSVRRFHFGVGDMPETDAACLKLTSRQREIVC